VTVTRNGAGPYAWHQGTVVSGAPMALSGSSAAAQQASQQRRFASC